MSSFVKCKGETGPGRGEIMLPSDLALTMPICISLPWSNVCHCMSFLRTRFFFLVFPASFVSVWGPIPTSWGVEVVNSLCQVVVPCPSGMQITHQVLTDGCTVQPPSVPPRPPSIKAFQSILKSSPSWVSPEDATGWSRVCNRINTFRTTLYFSTLVSPHRPDPRRLMNPAGPLEPFLPIRNKCGII